MIYLEEMGQRICIIGPSNSGKSTLAQNLAEKLNLPVLHLDQLAHIPWTNWQRRANEDWLEEHDQFIKNPAWVIDGTYSFCMPQRFQRATFVIWLDFNSLISVFHYFKRSMKNYKLRPGGLENATNEFSWKLVHYLLFGYKKNRTKHIAILYGANVPFIRMDNFNQLNQYYNYWHLPKKLTANQVLN